MSKKVYKVDRTGLTSFFFFLIGNFYFHVYLTNFVSHFVYFYCYHHFNPVIPKPLATNATMYFHQISLIFYFRKYSFVSNIYFTLLFYLFFTTDLIISTKKYFQDSIS
uniref:Uncharacterized protein n=1 Tax=Cacopsylla melanoneura TaxID=428564 RepID=A0A8D8PU94_9HEMI